MNSHEKDVSTKHCAPQTHTRISDPDEHDRRSRRPQTPSGQRAQAPDRSGSAQALTALLDVGAPRLRFPKTARLLARREFLSVQRYGKRRYSPHFVVITTPARTQGSRLGITATRRFGNAVVRNRVKRYLREFFRVAQAHLVPALDMVIIPQTGAETLGCVQVAEELGRVLSLDGKAR